MSPAQIRLFADCLAAAGQAIALQNVSLASVEAAGKLIQAAQALNDSATTGVAIERGKISREQAEALVAQPAELWTRNGLVMHTVAQCVIESVRRGGDAPTEVAKQVVAAFAAAEAALTDSSRAAP